MRSRLLPASMLAVSLVLGACASDRFGADVSRFHLGQPLARGTVYLEPADPSVAQGLEYRTYEAAVEERLRALGFTPVDTLAKAELVGVIGYGQTTREGLASRPPVTIGIGGGTFGGNVGVGLGGSFGVGGSRGNEVNVNALTLRLRRRSDNTTIWEGRAVAEAREGSEYAALSEAVPVLADALLSNFPGPSGETVRYTPPR